ncbi:MAG: hypothetical protein ACLU37_01150 [Collinsella sp.]
MPNNEEAAIEVWPSPIMPPQHLKLQPARMPRARLMLALMLSAPPKTMPPRPPCPNLPTLDLGDGKPLPVLIPESEQFANRLRKNARLRVASGQSARA